MEHVSIDRVTRSDSVSSARVAVSWDNFGAKPAEGDSLLFTILLEAKTDASLDNILKINAERLAPEAYPKLSSESRPSLVALNFEEEIDPKAPFELLPCRPNPFREATAIPFFLPIATDLTLTISDAMGRVVFEKTERHAAGRGEIRVRREDLQGGAGVYFFQIKSAEMPGLSGKFWLLGE